MNLQFDNYGYIALITTILVSAILLVITITLSLVVFQTRFNALDSYYKEANKALAKACQMITLGRFVNNPDFSGGVVSLSAHDCMVSQVSEESSRIIFNAQAFDHNISTTIRTTFDLGTKKIIVSEELY